MGITVEYSTEYLKASDPLTYGRMDPDVTAQKLHVQEFNFTQGAAAGDEGSSAGLMYFQPGRYVFFPKLSQVQWTAFGSSRVMDIGFSAYTGEDAVAVAAAPVAFDADIDVSSAGIAAMGSDVAANTGGCFTIKSSTGFSIMALVTGGTIPIAARLQGHIAFAKVGS